MSIEEKFKNRIKRFFPNNQVQAEAFLYESDYLDCFLELDDNVTLEDIITFIKDNMDILIKSYSQDELFKNNLLERNNTIDRTKAHLITNEVIKNLLNNIINGKMNKESAVMLLDIISFINIYGIHTNKEKVHEILDSGIYHIIRNADIYYEDYIVPKDKLNEMTDTLIRWEKICGSNILHNVFNLDLLSERLNIMLNSNLEELEPFKEEIESILKDVTLAIQVRDNNYEPRAEEIERINKVFEKYKKINVMLINEALSREQYACIHFVQTDDVNYQIVNGSIRDTKDKERTVENSYNTKQNYTFINSYISNLLEQFKNNFSIDFDIRIPEHRAYLEQSLEQFNNTLNNNPLGRLPIPLRETGDGLRTFIRPSSPRLSCSFTNLKLITPHLSRKIGILVRPKNENGIISISTRYTKQKEYEDFRNDGISYPELVKQTEEQLVNETCLDINNCEVTGVIILSEEQKVIEKGTRLASNYGVPLIRINNNINDEKKL